tara:strand:- start:16 stop:357 length:342 start_codon:yes stop_codon:yes gene_type:complete
MMRKILGLILLGFLLSGCYASSLTYVGAGAGIVQGKSIQSLASQSASLAVKHKTGKSPIEHVLNPHQIKTYNSTKSKLNPCEQTPELCLSISQRIKSLNRIFDKKNIQNTHKN